MKVLVIDDDTRLLTEVSRILTGSGHSADCVDNADDAVAMVEAGRYDFVLVDYRMPKHDGAWFMSHAKIPRRTKVLLVTSYIDRNVVSQMFHAGISGYVMKPFDGKELLMHLEFHSNNQRSKQAMDPLENPCA